MKFLKTRIAPILLVLILLSSLVLPFSASAASSLTYSSESNSGVRDVVCTTLDGTSAAEYYQNYDYDALSALDADDLFDALQTLMRDTHTYVSSYDDCHYMADRTDCEGNDGSVSLIYTSYSATMDQWNGWNREHIWPQSLGGDNTRGGGADLHHIRPSDQGVNSSRGNKKYGEVGNNASEKYGSKPAVGVLGGTYNSTYFEPLDNVKGDVARICLYVYVRWNSDWGASSITSVFQSVDVLLEWCELDPVDTWEMGRNEVVQDIQGNRNVFIDYPEYAWLLFDREVPDDMTTPSGEAQDGTSDTPTVPDTPAEPDEPDVDAPVGDSATLSFASNDQRVSLSSTEQVWEQNGITFTNYKSESSNAVADYANPVRLYQGSSVTIEGEASIAKLELTCASAEYAATLAASVGAEASVRESTVTITLSSPASSYTIDKLTAQVRLNGLTVYYAKNAEPTCRHTNTITSTQSATCAEAGSLTVTCGDCGKTLSSTKINALGHDDMNGVCLRCGYAENDSPAPSAGGWTLVTDASELKAGDRIVIVSGSFAAGSIGSSIMASVDGVTASDGMLTALPDGAVILTLGGQADAWTLSNADGQLLGATAVKKLAWGKGETNWKITVSDGSATIQNATSTYGRFLYNVSSPRFTTYTSATNKSMLLPQIYKFVEGSGEPEEVKIAAASVTIGTSLAINYYVSGYDKTTDYYMVFTMNGVASARVTGVEKDGYLVFTFANIPPQCMGDNVYAALYGTDEAPDAVMESYSIRAYAERILDKYGNNKELADLIADMLRYGAAAQVHQNYKTNALVTDGISLDGYGSDALPSDDESLRSLEDMTNGDPTAPVFVAAGVRFDFDNKIYVRFQAEDLDGITLTVNGVVVSDLSDRVKSVGDGTYIFYTDGILATELGRAVTFTISENGTPRQTLTYSVNSYVYVKGGDFETEDAADLTPLANLVRALYRYGLSAEAYTK